MDFFTAFLEMFRNSDQFIAHMSAEYGIYVYLFLFTVYFLETGIVICALLPGDSLIFVSGAASAAGILDPFGAFFAIALGACFGNTVAYAIGYYLGNKIYDGSIKWIDQQQMTKTQAFFAKHGKLTVVLARFVPIIRSFAPLVAGAAKMNRLNFEASGRRCPLGRHHSLSRTSFRKHSVYQGQSFSHPCRRYCPRFGSLCDRLYR